MECRPFCAACCTAPSISSPIPGMPGGKPSGVTCIHLTSDLKCALFGKPERPQVCIGFQAEELVCGSCRDEALKILYELENS